VILSVISLHTATKNNNLGNFTNLIHIAVIANDME